MKLISTPIIFLFITLVTLSGCEKYLDAKPNQKLVIPSKVADLQGLLDNFRNMNRNSTEASEIAADNYYLTDVKYAALTADRMRDAYLWKPGLFVGMGTTDWHHEYNIVYQANVVLDYLPDIEKNSLNTIEWDNCKGQALVFRAKSFYEIAQVWAKAYDSATAKTDLGIPLRLNSDFNEPTRRASIEQTYNQIIADLKAAIPLLPNIPVFVYRPSKPAAYGLLARTYLTIGDYKLAKLYADSCLQLRNVLMDYNALDPNLARPFSPYTYTNPEDILHSYAVATNLNMAYVFATVDSTLISSYESDDLRKVIFFKQNQDGTYFFRGSYDASNAFNYNGLATDEMYVTRAECFAREGKIVEAMKDINDLLKTRWKMTNGVSTYVEKTANSPQQALDIVLNERRKELVYRMLRFTDIKRLNKKGANIVLKRIIQGQTYTLPPNDARYALPIPDNVIEISGIQQN